MAARLARWLGLLGIVSGLLLWGGLERANQPTAGLDPPVVAAIDAAPAEVVTTSAPEIPATALPMEPVYPARLMVDAGRPVRLRLERTGIDTPVVDADAPGGKYRVPAFAAGHHEDSVNPGQPGNAVLNGHVESINAGHVFAVLPRVEVGDDVVVVGERATTVWKVDTIDRFTNTETSWMIGDGEPALTLYTCVGSFNWVTMDYSQRLVVKARLVEIRMNGDGSGT